jgi:acyl transferase domain-containing protein
MRAPTPARRGSRDVGRIAVIGMAGRFPGAATVTDLWRNVRAGVDSVTAVRARRHPHGESGGANGNGRRHPATTRSWRQFDARFFGYSEADAALMDPQLRVLHECVWQALEDAGYAPDGELGRVGMYVGGSPDTRWLCAAARGGATAGPRRPDVNDSFATCLSYRFGLQGPSLTLHTSSSSSLVAIHVASQAISTGECDMAIAGGVAIGAPVDAGLAGNGAHPGPTPCRAFDAQANGAPATDGCGVVVLKALSKAVADGDHIYAVVRGTAINNDGRQKLRYGAPSVAGQVDVMRRAHEAADVDGETVAYVEAHGSGGPLGDAVEIEALTQAFGTRRRQFCAIGSIKTNIGDLHHAAGIAAFIKAVLAVRDGVVPPTLHYRRPNPRIDFPATPFVVNTTLRKWTLRPRRACVNAVGAGGTNAHVVIEDAPRVGASASNGRRSHLLVLSANQAPVLEQAHARLRARIEGDPHLDIGDVAHTLRTGRVSLPFRRAMVCRSRGEALAVLRGRHPQRVWTHVSSPPVRLTFLFQGHSARHPLTDGTLYAQQAEFRAAVDRCLDALGPLKGRVARALGLDSTSRKRADSGDPRSAPAALFVYQYACATLLKTLGVQPSALLGEGVGELVAGCLAGVFRLEDVLRLLGRRAGPLDARAIAAIERQPPLVALLSSPTARPVGAADATDAAYWTDRVRQPSCLSDGIVALLQMPAHVLVDIGPDETLRTAARRPSIGSFTHTLISLGGDAGDGEGRLLAGIGQVWTLGIDVHWASLDARGRRRVSLPTSEFGGTELPDIT